MCLTAIAAIGGTPDVPSVVELRDAAARGDVQALMKLGRIHLASFEFPKALACFGQAADRGNIDAFYELGAIYATGKPRMSNPEAIAKDPDLALKYFTKAANAGHTSAQRELGVRYRSGNGVPKDEVEAYKWFRLAAREDVTSKSVYLPDIARNMPREKITEAERRAAQFKPTATGGVGDLLLGRLRLQAVSGSGQDRIALVNGALLRVGEEATLSVMGESVKLRCTAIRDRSVTILTPDGMTRELQMGGP